MLRTFALSFAIMLLAASASAQTTADPGAIAARTSMEESLRRAYQPFSETTKINPSGTREDRVMMVRADWDELVRAHGAAYAQQSQISGSACKGYFVAAAKRLATFTLEHDGLSFMLIAQETSDGVTLTLWGNTTLSQDRRVAPIRQQRPYHRGLPPAPVRSYGL